MYMPIFGLCRLRSYLRLWYKFSIEIPFHSKLIYKAPVPLVDTHSSEIIEFPWVVIDTESMRIVDAQHFYVKPDNMAGVTAFTSKLTGITPDMLVGQENLQTVLKKVLRIIILSIFLREF